MKILPITVPWTVLWAVPLWRLPLPSISVALDACWAYRNLNALRPLWKQLTDAAPHVVLGTPPSRRTDLTSFADLRIRLLRRTIEIRDAWLALRGYVTDEDHRWIRDELLSHGLAGEQLDAAIEAAWLTCAVDARHHGRPYVPPASRPARGGSDLRDEVRWLRLIDHARRSKAVATAAATLNHRIAVRHP
ncbi:DUF6545 domain-containing protein [Sphaerisporangium sp. NPDC051017]|uniref:DUF6545 domain-containing protein n=1 Tax=Sphaerisporangium sp. NPDC051017 TaxID=3154636 RepID=UPI003419FB63